MKPIYLDYNATTPISPAVREAMLPYLDEFFGNPSSSHWYGVQAKKAVETARRQVAQLVGAGPEDILFTSGGSEANNLAITGAAMARRERGQHIITSAVEHPAVENVCRYLQRQGFQITTVPVDEFGRVAPADIEAAIRPDTILITIMHANNEVGTVQPIADISRLARQHGILLHTDAAQSVGKIPVNVDELGVDLLSIAGHKLYAPKGVGALYVRRGVELQKMMHGADHERGMRAGTENVLELVGLGVACAEISDNLIGIMAHLKNCADRLWFGLQQGVPAVRRNGHPEHRLPNTVNVSFNGIEANTLLSELDTIAASAGAACHSDDITISPVLQAMGVPIEWAMGTVRFSVGKMTTLEEIDQALESITDAVKRLSGSAAKLQVHPDSDIRLTRFTHGLGCACKLRPQALEEVLRSLPLPEHPQLLVGAGTADDAAVYQLDEKTAIVQTVDFFTPIVDEPYDFGAIAAANALSDVYAMGGEPTFALNIVAFPSNRLPLSVLQEILRGAAEKAQEAGIVIAGGHTIDDTEPKYGMAVTGTVHPQKMWRNTGARPGDALILTKPLGTGILTTALKNGALEPNTEKVLIETMSALNRTAADTARAFNIHACTDVTGFGLLGHLHEMLTDGIDARLKAAATPILPGVDDMLQLDSVPGGTRANLGYAETFTTFDHAVPESTRIILADAQTSGGLLFAAPQAEADSLLTALKKRGVSATAVGEIIKGRGRIWVG